MPNYENVFLARQDVSAQQVTNLTETFSNIITENGGEVPKSEYWGLRNLAYKIKKNRKAHYVLLNIAAPPAALKEMERNMRINEDVIRYMTIRVDELEEEPSIMMRAKAAREDRARRDDRPDRGRERHGPKSDDGPRPAGAVAKGDGNKVAEGKGAEDKGAEDKVAEDKVAEDKVAEDKAAKDKVADSKGAEDKGAESKGAADESAKDKDGAEAAAPAETAVTEGEEK